MPVKIKHFGWVRDLPDQRDHLYSAPLLTLPVLPDKVDLRSQCPPVYNQGELGSCTANALAAAFQFGEMKEKETNPFMPSRLFIYYNERVLEHSVGSDSGAQLRDGMKTLAKQGVCPETDWPYDTTKFADKPPQKCFIEAVDHKATQYQRLVQNLTQMKGCLASGFPFVFGFTVYDSFESPEVAKTGVVPMPGTGESIVGGHAVMAVGYDEGQRVFIVRNSWGDTWGMKGYFTMPYSYLTQSDISSDFWTVRFVK